MKQVLQLVASLNPGGIERWILQILKALNGSEFKIDIFCRDQPGLWAHKAKSLGSAVTSGGFGLSRLYFGSHLERVLTEGQYDLLHCHLGLHSAYPVYLAKKIGIPVVTTFHGTDNPPQAKLFKIWPLGSLRSIYGRLSINYSLRNSDFVVCVSRAVVDSVVPQGYPIWKKLRVINHGVDAPPLATTNEKTHYRESLGWPKDAHVILHVGRFDEHKNQKGVLRIFEKVYRQLENTRLLFIGNGDLRPDVQRLAILMGLTEKVSFLGMRDDVLHIMTLSDLFLFPSIKEGFGLAAIEAAAGGLPVVGSRIPGLDEAVEDGQTGFLFGLHDHDGMADAIIKLLSDTGLSKTMGEAGKQRVQEHFSTEKMASQYLELYEKCLKQ